MDRINASVWKTEGDLVWLHCPGCGRRIEHHPFSRFDLPRYHEHRWSQCNARMIVIADPVAGRHEIELLTGHGTGVDSLQAHIRDRRTIQRLLTAVYLLTERP